MPREDSPKKEIPIRRKFSNRTRPPALFTDWANRNTYHLRSTQGHSPQVGRGWAKALPGRCPLGLSQEKGRKGEEHYLAVFRGSESKGNSNEFALREGSGARLPSNVAFHLSLQLFQFTESNCGETIWDFNSIYKSLKAFM